MFTKWGKCFTYFLSRARFSPQWLLSLLSTVLTLLSLCNNKDSRSFPLQHWTSFFISLLHSDWLTWCVICQAAIKYPIVILIYCKNIWYQLCLSIKSCFLAIQESNTSRTKLHIYLYVCKQHFCDYFDHRVFPLFFFFLYQIAAA